MNRILISEIDIKVNAGKDISYEQALKRIHKEIVKTIDSSFPEKEFLEWVDSDDEKPFKWNKRYYYWNEE